MRQGTTLSYLLSDHLGSTSLVTDASGNRTSELRYKPWGESRYSFGTLPTKYTFTGQYSYMDDPSTPGSEGFGLMYYGARWFDPSLGRFISPDSIIPSGAQGYDRYAYVSNKPTTNTDPSGHRCVGLAEECKNDDGSTGMGMAGGTRHVDAGTHNCGVPGKPACNEKRPEPPQSDAIDWGCLGIVGGYCVGFKAWADIDKFSLVVDILSILGDLGFLTATPVGMILWIVSEALELISLGKTFDDMELSGDPNLVGVVLMVVGILGKGERLLPVYGYIGNAVALGTDVISITPAP